MSLQINGIFSSIFFFLEAKQFRGLDIIGRGVVLSVMRQICFHFVLKMISKHTHTHEKTTKPLKRKQWHGIKRTYSRHDIKIRSREKKMKNTFNVIKMTLRMKTCAPWFSSQVGFSITLAHKAYLKKTKRNYITVGMNVSSVYSIDASECDVEKPRPHNLVRS